MSTATAVEVVLIGAAVGWLGGLFGKGGSAVATPLLALAGVAPIAALASPLPATVPGTLVAAVAYWRRGLVDWGITLRAIAVGVPAAAAGAFATRWIGGAPLVVASELLVIGLGIRVVLTPHAARPAEVATRGARLLLVALVAGFAAGLLANSGGFLLAPLLVTVVGLPMTAALGTSLAVACVLAVPATAVHAALGHIDWSVTALFAVASVPCSYLGARTAIRLPATVLERGYGGALVVLGALPLLLAV
jgi:uncharacterized protein